MCFQNGPKFQKVEKTAENNLFTSIVRALCSKFLDFALIMLENRGFAQNYAGIMLYAPIFLRHINYAGIIKNYAGRAHRSLKSILISTNG